MPTSDARLDALAWMPADLRAILSFDGEVALVATRDERLLRLDLRRPDAPRTIAETPPLRAMTWLAADAERAYAAGDESGLAAFSLPGDAPARLLARWPTHGAVESLLVDGDQLHVVDEAGLAQVPRAAPAAATAPAVVLAGFRRIGAMARADRWLYGSYDYGLRVADLADPARPVLVAELELDGQGTGLAVAGSVVYLGDGDAGGVHVIDVRTPDRPRAVGRVADWIVQGVAVAAGRLYLAGGTLEVADLADPRAPVLAGRFAAPDDSELWTVAIHGGLILTAGAGGLAVLRAPA